MQVLDPKPLLEIPRQERDAMYVAMLSSESNDALWAARLQARNISARDDILALPLSDGGATVVTVTLAARRDLEDFFLTHDIVPESWAAVLFEADLCHEEAAYVFISSRYVRAQTGTFDETGYIVVQTTYLPEVDVALERIRRDIDDIASTGFERIDVGILAKQ